MHSANRPLFLLTTLAAVCFIGCRGANPFNRFVRVTQEPDTQLPDIEAPPQRLATAKPREDSRSASTGTVADSSPHVTRVASARPSIGSQADSSPTERTLSDRSQSASEPTRSTQPAAVSASAKQPLPDLSDLSDLSDEESRDLLAAFSDYPPEVQREALRRLVAATSLRASRTAQPHGLDLSEEMDTLPELPAATNETPEVPPQRIASDSKASTDTDASLVTTEVEEMEAAETPVVAKAAADSDSGQAPIKPVSASRDASEPSMVARANVDSSLSIDLDPSALAGQLSEQALYTSLLNRLATPVEGESEAERASRLIKLRHLMVLSGDPDQAVQKIEGLPQAEQEFLRHQLLGLWTMIDPHGHPVSSRRYTAALPQIREAAKFAAAATDSLEVRSLAFCTEIESYGQIKPFSGNRFDAGEQVILYCEIENFTVTKKEQGFETHLQGSYDIFNESNEKVVSQLLPADQQISANYLRDYFIAYQMHLPAQLSAGTYRLQLTMEDVAGKKYGQSSIPFEIAEQPGQ